LEEALALLTLLELQFIAQQALGEGVWGNDQQVINPEAVGGQGLTGLQRQRGPREGEVGSTIAMLGPKLPPKMLAIPNLVCQGRAKLLLPKRRST
jgi:hypothetical protein